MIRTIIPDELEKQFRLEVGRRMGMKKGNLAQAVQEAIERWTNQGKETRDRK